MPAIAPGESPELDSLTISVVGTDSVELVIMVGIMVVVLDAASVVVLDAPSVVVLDGLSVVVLDGLSVVVLNTLVEAVVFGAMLVDIMFFPPHRNTDRKIEKG